MQIVKTPGSARAIARTLPRPVGFVPTMGALHRGHRSLVDRARAENASVVASIFVNPLQFGPHEDYERYPRALEGDLAQFEEAGVDLVYTPSAERMYRPGFITTIDLGSLGARLEGSVRLGHFRGVATVVAKLFHAIEPTRLYLGQKDVQQTAAIRAMIDDLDIPVTVVVSPTVREADGLALSSRNAYLTEEERAAAPSLYRALLAVRDAVESKTDPTEPRIDLAESKRDLAESKSGMIDAQADARRAIASACDAKQAIASARVLLQVPLAWEYLEVVDAVTFEPLDELRRPSVLVGAARAGKTRLIDNVVVLAADGSDPIVTPPLPYARHRKEILR